MIAYHRPDAINLCNIPSPPPFALPIVTFLREPATAEATGPGTVVVSPVLLSMWLDSCPWPLHIPMPSYDQFVRFLSDARPAARFGKSPVHFLWREHSGNGTPTRAPGPYLVISTDFINQRHSAEFNHTAVQAILPRLRALMDEIVREEQAQRDAIERRHRAIIRAVS